MNNDVVYDYDCRGDSLFIYCIEDYEYEVSLELGNDVILDIDTEGKPVAFEFLNASKIFNLDKCYFNNLAKICIQYNRTKETIILNVQLIVSVPNETQCDECGVFLERTAAAMIRVENDDNEWLSVNDFLKELETW